jgi:glycosyltransferase involved in cell wall biosynthesis
LHILINDFIGGVLDRGIPLYVRNLIYGLQQEGARVTVVRAPSAFRKLPRSLFYGISVLFEQLAMPIIGLFSRADVAIYPYNSIALLDVLSKRGRIVVHDLEMLDRRQMSPSRLYYAACFATLKHFVYPVFSIADLVKSKIFASGIFGNCPILVLPNTFYLFENLVGAAPADAPAPKTVLLCTGSTSNKDLATVVARHLPMAMAQGFRISILGLHKKTDLAALDPVSSFIAAGQLKLCGQLSDQEVANAYRSHEVVWVHSLREGFGRCVVEGRLAGRPVVCSAIPEFTTLTDEGVHLYESAEEFVQLLMSVPQAGKPRPYTGYPYQELLRTAIRNGL